MGPIAIWPQRRLEFHMTGLAGKAFIVTGGTRGIGHAVATRLLEGGAKVCITGRNAERLTALQSDIDPKGRSLITVQQDVADPQSWARVIASTVGAFKSVQGIVNNAGMHQTSPLEDISDTDFDRMLATNARSVFLGTQYGFRILPMYATTNAPGSIVNVSSIAGLVGTSFQSAYAMSKGAVQTFSMAAASEAIDRNLPIRVNTVNPGMVDTDMGSELAEALVHAGLAQNADHAQKGLSKSYMNKRFSSAREVAATICFLLSDEAKHITGSHFKIDGGSICI